MSLAIEQALDKAGGPWRGILTFGELSTRVNQLLNKLPTQDQGSRATLWERTGTIAAGCAQVSDEIGTATERKALLACYATLLKEKHTHFVGSDAREADGLLKALNTYCEPSFNGHTESLKVGMIILAGSDFHSEA